MTRLFILASVFICASFLALPVLAAPRINVDEPVYNAGVMERGQPIVHDFIIKNTGDQPLTIKVKPC